MHLHFRHPLYTTCRLTAVVAALILASACGSPPKDDDTDPDDRTPCTDSCDSKDVRRCAGNVIEQCSQGSNGCLAWTVAETCDGGTCDESTLECITDPCGGAPVEGRCVDATTIELCAVSSGNAAPGKQIIACGTGESCSKTPKGTRCVLTAQCRDGQSECTGPNQLRTCVGGTWTSDACTGGCIPSPVGATCATPATTKNLNGMVRYEARGPNESLTDWSAQPFLAALPHLLVLSFSGEDVIDATYTDDSGAFTIRIPTAPTPSDALVLLPAADDGQDGLAFIMVNPGFDGPGKKSMFEIDDTKAAPWMWSWRTDSFSSTADLVITEQMGSGVARVFDYLRYAYFSALGHFQNQPGLSLVVWMGPGISWDCGACFAEIPVSFLNTPIDSHVWIPMDSNQSYWADPATGHELGHWLMQSYGTSPNEGGPHLIGVPTFPGQAWSEGFATWYSSDLRESPIYYDKQGGAMFWANLAERRYSGPAWRMPTPQAGLLQLIDENEVAAMLWELSTHQDGNSAPLYTALASPQMNTTPWLRGYTRHTWELTSSGLSNVVNTGESKPFLADFLDALNCAGYPRTAIEYAAYPHEFYPYPVTQPLCR